MQQKITVLQSSTLITIETTMYGIFIRSVYRATCFIHDLVIFRQFLYI